MYRNPDDTFSQWLRELADAFFSLELIGPLAMLLALGALLFAAIVWYRNRGRGTPS